jgi:hypothetical protein
MKKSSLILVILFGLFLVSLLGSFIVLKGEYNKMDKRDPYWNYSKIEQGSFHHLKIDGGNITKISFKPSSYAAIGILNYWMPTMAGRVRATITNDTLYVYIQPGNKSLAERDAMRSRELIGISCPELRSVEGTNTNLQIFKLKQKDLVIRLAGRSHVEVESNIPDFDSISVRQRDSSDVEFEMSEDIRSSGVMQAKAISADIQGHSLLDIGHFRIGSLYSSIGDTAGIVLSGATLRRQYHNAH